MSIKHAIFGENSLTKVAGLYTDQELAEDAARQLTRAAELDESQVKVVGPPDDRGLASSVFARKLEPEQTGIWHTLIRAHLFTGSIGVVAGVVGYLGFLAAGNAAVVSAPGISLFAFIFFSVLFGLMVGGLLTLRPDHYRVIAAVRRAIRHGCWAVVTHPVTRHQVDEAMGELRVHSYRVARSF